MKRSVLLIEIYVTILHRHITSVDLRVKVKNEECLVPCTGLYSDTSDDFLEQKTMEGEIKSFFVKNHSLIYFFRISITE